MGSTHYELSLRIKHPNMDLSAVCQSLGLVPTHIWRAGEQRRTPKGTLLAGERESSYCSVKLSDDPDISLSNMIKTALVTLSAHRKILDEVKSSGGTISFSVGWFSSKISGAMIDWITMGSIADLKMDLEINIYCPDTQEDIA
jgi:hypothetical protein